MHVLVVGANRGIGLALVEKFISEGHQVTATCRKSSDQLDQSGAKVIVEVDVTEIASLAKAASAVQPLDMMIHSAGILLEDDLASSNHESMLKQFEINSIAPFKSVLAFRSKLKPGSKIGLMTSRMGSVSDNTSSGHYGYRASKSALNSIGKSLAVELKDEDIGVFLLHPGYVRTEMTKMNGLIDAKESAAGLYKVMMDKTIEQTGSFWHTNGEELPW